MATELSILLPNGQVLAVQVYINDPILGPIPWDGAIVVPPPVGGATAANQILETALLASIDSKLVDHPLTDVELRATPVDVLASIDTTGLALESKQDIGNASLASIDAKITNPLPVSGAVVVSAVNLDIRDLVFATDKVDVSGSSGVGVTGLFATETTQLLQATSAHQDIEDALLTSIDNKLTSPLEVTLPAVATESAPSYTEGNQVALSTDLFGSLRVIVAPVLTEFNFFGEIDPYSSVNNFGIPDENPYSPSSFPLAR